MNETFELDEAPTDCPWQVSSHDPAQVIDAVFGSLADELPTFVRALKEACTRVVAQRGADGEWRLLYHLERLRPEAMCVRFPSGSNALAVYMGGPPAPQPPLSEAANAAGWTQVPPQLATFAAVHDGFGPESSRFGVEAILPVRSMAPLNDMHPEWLEVRCDSVGNRRLMLRERATESMTVDWDHETGELAEEITFFHWLDQHVACELLDLDRWDFPQGPYPAPEQAQSREPFEAPSFDSIATKPHGSDALYNYYAVDFEAWRTEVGRRAVDAILSASSDAPAGRYLGEVLSMTTLGRLQVALGHIIDPTYVAAHDTDDCAHSWSLEALCVLTGCVLDLDGLDDVLEFIDEKLRCSPLVDDLPFGLPSSSTGTPGIAHATKAQVGRHMEDIGRRIQEGEFGEQTPAARRYQQVLSTVVEAGLGLIYIGW